MMGEPVKIQLIDLVPTEWRQKHKTVCFRLFSTNIPVSIANIQNSINQALKIAKSLIYEEFYVTIIRGLQSGGLHEINVDLSFVDGTPHLNAIANTNDMHGDCILVAAPANDGSDASIDFSSNIIRSTLTIFFGSAAALELKRSIYVDLSTNVLSAVSRSIEQFLPYKHAGFETRGFDFTISDDVAAHIRVGLNLLARSIGEIDRDVKFALYWMSLEAICGGKESRQRFADQAISDYPWIKDRYGRLRRERNNLFHEGKSSGFSQNDEIFLRYLLLCAIRWKSGANIENGIDIISKFIPQEN